jgi:hypothetical protein
VTAAHDSPEMRLVVAPNPAIVGDSESIFVMCEALA